MHARSGMRLLLRLNQARQQAGAGQSGSELPHSRRRAGIAEPLGESSKSSPKRAPAALRDVWSNGGEEGRRRKSNRGSSAWAFAATKASRGAAGTAQVRRKKEGCAF